ncbi:amidohydrolase family protein [Sinosporangium siamense]|uniref:4-hydroxyphenyl-beta-ketoacyl-CoA hydrolase n=1 Tax=Sinosporangium siamense TaxID=1367973 RepID=A0A919V613_9ACTN|nr:amidohydrolase family protein [Sinosporangium siamense]GII90512.1 4-hydroxyphenyl-beta-ketoacyl-CoA hydrolase [Sinosporangium siamense]
MTDDLVAIDVHTHPQTEEFLAAMGRRRGQMGSHFGKERTPVSFAAQADVYRERRMMAVIVNSDDETQSGVIGAPNDLLGRAQAEHPDVFLAFAGIDPWKGKAAIEEIRRCHAEYGIKGVGELNPGRQRFFPNDRHFYPIWEACAELGLVVMFHGGFLGAGAGTPGGMGYKLEYTRPIPYLDDVAADFPELKIISAHPGWPFHLDNLAACWHKSNFYIDLSGWAPKYWPPDVVHYANSIITKRVLFGTDWPVLEVDRWVKEFDDLGFKETSRRRIMLDNAKELFGLV